MDKQKGRDIQPIPETMLEAVRQFADPDVAHDFFVQLRWPNGIACPRKGCGSADMVSYMAKHRRWYCGECKGQFSAKVGTIFEDSPIGFDKWLPAIWLIASNRNGISSCELARALKVTQKTAWFMLHRIRLAMNTGAFEQFTGTVEVDETYVGGKAASKPKRVRKMIRSGNPTEDKVMVLGMVERKGRVRAWVLPGSKPTTKRVIPMLRQHIHPEATVYTDAAPIYKDLNEYFMVHESVNHTADEYVRDQVSTIARFDADFRALKIRHLGADVPMHEYDLRTRKLPPFDGLRDLAKWSAFRDDLAKLFAAYDFGIVVCCLHKPNMQTEYGTPFHPYNYALENIIERTAMESKNFARTWRVVAEDREAGLNVALGLEMLRLQTDGCGRGIANPSSNVDAAEVRRKVYPEIAFRKKIENDSGLQVADLAVGPIVRHMYGLDAGEKRSLLDIVLPKIVRAKDGKLRGFGVKCYPRFPAKCPL